MTSGLGQDATDPLTEACGLEPTFTCKRVFEWTYSEFWAVAAEWILDRPIRIALICWRPGSSRGCCSEP